MTLKFNGTDYELITNYKYQRLVQKCCQSQNKTAVTGKMFVAWLLKNKYIILKKNDTPT